MGGPPTMGGGANSEMGGVLEQTVYFGRLEVMAP